MVVAGVEQDAVTDRAMPQRGRRFVENDDVDGLAREPFALLDQGRRHLDASLRGERFANQDAQVQVAQRASLATRPGAEHVGAFDLPRARAEEGGHRAKDRSAAGGCSSPITAEQCSTGFV